ncbi:MAG: hypothetical protein CMJ18_19115 [Phycisphaeraceae bacterium]|nr:hypothetical protein [Phycisphaeraceae bacterium]
MPAAPRIESLESRTLLSVSVIEGPVGSGIITFSEDAAGSDNLSLRRSASTGNLEHNSGATWIDSGVAVTALDFIRVELGSGDDSLVLEQSNGSPLPGVELLFDGGDGNDLLWVQGQAAATEALAIRPDGTFSDRHEVSGLRGAVPLSTIGLERLRYSGVGGDDTVTVEPGAGDDDVSVSGGSERDLVTTASLPAIELEMLATLAIDAGDTRGGDTVRLVTTSLVGADLYQVLGGANDLLVIEGSDADGDQITISDPDEGAGLRATIVHQNSVNGGVIEARGALGRLRVETGGGDDLVAIDVDGNGLIAMPIEIDAGGGADDVLQVSGTPSTPVSDVIYLPGSGADGRLLYYIRIRRCST